jgi:hypothetical protein
VAAKKPRSPSRGGRQAGIARRPVRSAPELLQDFVDVVSALNDSHARFLVVGAYAMAAHGVPRATGDFDIWVEPTHENAPRVFAALARFGAPLQSLGVTVDDFVTPGVVCQIGLPPRRIDITTLIDGVTFDEAWAGRLEGALGNVRLSYIGREALLRNKEAVGRAKDLADLEALRSTSVQQSHRATAEAIAADDLRTAASRRSRKR